MFGVERLEEHARSLAAAQPVTAGRSRGHPLATRLADNASALLEARKALAKAADAGLAITPAGEWLLDNYHLVDARIRDIRADLPPRYYRQLPKLADGPFAHYPRVFGLAWAFVAHTDSRFEPSILCRYLDAYQEMQPLTIGELWAVGITVRIVLIENLRRLAEQIVQNHRTRQEADNLADRLLGHGPYADLSVTGVLAELERVELPHALAVQLLHRLRDQVLNALAATDGGFGHSSRITQALTWLDRCLAAQKTTAEDAVQAEHQRQGAANVTVRNIITSLRLIAEVDWADVFEASSRVDRVLADGTVFADMDFGTRNLYRTAIEDLARGSPCTELDVARLAVAAAKRGGGGERQSDVGYHLLAGGRALFERSITFHPPFSIRLRRLGQGLGIGGYAGAIAIVAALLLAVPLYLVAEGAGIGWLCLLGALGAVTAVDAAVALVNWGVALTFGCTAFPALELRDGVPKHLRTLVAVPMMLTNAATIAQQIESLEVHHLASPDGELHFALLSDWSDSSTEHRDGDEALVSAARAGIAALNRRHGPAPAGERFFLLHRRRVWNESEGRWIGWERKRGKLHELNGLLRGRTDTTYGDIAASLPADIVYVVTLDADTRLPRDTVRRLIGKMAHPLNRPRFDPASGRVVEGYGVLQPRVTPSLPVSREGSAFQRIFSSMNGIDPYAAAASDVYQDLFAEGSYAGKGIYDIDAFEAALQGRVADSTLLSHDLFEGLFARAGLASDVEVVEEFPAHYDVAALRDHRWARGDWQLLPWLLGQKTVIPAIGRWKMLDNLRRTVSAPMAVIGLMAGLALPFDVALPWTLFVLTALLLPSVIPVVGSIRPGRSGITLRSHTGALGRDVRLAVCLYGLTVTFLAHRAWVMTDAIVRTLIRLFMTRRHLLEWVTAAQATIGPRPTLAGFYRRMVSAPVIGAATLAVGWAQAWPMAGFFAVLWLLSPAVAYGVSRSPAVAGRVPMSKTDARALRKLARRTWRFFETFVTAEDHMLPPDNFQENPFPVLAHRTSPTNMGLYLLSTVAACDLGWIGVNEAMDRLGATLTTMDGLARFRGHFYNWYDTRDLRPLEPNYVSSVDSGNLAGHLIAVANALKHWRHKSAPVANSVGADRMGGIIDAVGLARDAAARLNVGHKTRPVTWAQLDANLDALEQDACRAFADGETLSQRLRDLAVHAETTADIAEALAGEHPALSADMVFWVNAAWRSIASHRRDCDHEPDGRLQDLERTARALALRMEFGFLFDPRRKLLSIGYRVPDGALDSNCYDLLASEARLASFVAIAKGDITAKHWFHLGRSVTPVAHGAALISWSGSMFEYLMPSLIIRAPDGSLLEQTNQLIVLRQIAYGKTLGTPWGISESAYNVRDLEATYQYSNFGIPGLGLKRGLGDNAVIAPYATALAAMVDPHGAVVNFEALAAAGAQGRYGFYEALDYTPIRLPDGESVAVVSAFMAHHQGMTVVAITNALMDGVMRARFHSEPIVQATELLLQERMPRDVMVARPRDDDIRSHGAIRESASASGRRISSAHEAAPSTHLLSNGHYTVMVTGAGSGYSRWNNLAVTRWCEDATRDDWGAYIYLKDLGSGDIWSAGFQPSCVEPDDYGVTFLEGRAEFLRRDGTLTTMLEILVSEEDDAEVRRISLTNSGPTTRRIEVTTYAELVLAVQADDTAHPAFSKLFIETEYLAPQGVILATRRRREPTEPEIWSAHASVVDGGVWDKPEIETDRARFIGRGGSLREPDAMMGCALSNTVGAVLDPIFSIRRRVLVAPGATVRIAFWTVVAPSRQEALDLIDKHRDATAFERAATLAWTQAQMQLYHLGLDPSEAGLFQRLAGHLLYATPGMRPVSNTIACGSGTQSDLWAHGISGDLPILLLRIATLDDIDIARQLLLAREYWKMKGFEIDLVILNERLSSYVQDMQGALEALVHTSQARILALGDEAKGRVVVLRADLITAQAAAMLLSVARVVLSGSRGRLSDQLDRAHGNPLPPPSWSKPDPVVLTPKGKAPALELEFFNGLGGFADHGREYVTILGPGQSTPAPWINVISNPAFGFQVSAEGGGFTWAGNSRENKLTPWSNDPVTDPSGEAFYISDSDTGTLWSPTAQPIRDPDGTYVAHHGWGYSRFDHTGHGIESTLTQSVPLADPIKISRLTLRNRSGRARRLSVTAYVEWVLGPSRSASAPFVRTMIDPGTGALFAVNSWSTGFGGRVAFADLGGRQSERTGDRRDFIGRNGTLAAPRGLRDGKPWSYSVGAGLDPCGALRTSFVLPANGVIEIVFFLGQAETAEQAATLVKHYRSADLDAVQGEVDRYWHDVLGAVQVKTPDRSMDIMLNGWLLYQTLACRLWARSAFYQSSGAYGFRDQLQDGMAFAAAQPQITRAHLLRAAARQFVEGDVQHWWLPHSGQGVRTRISDDRVWLPYAVAQYVETTQDAAILDESIAFLEGPALSADRHDDFFLPTASTEGASLFEHCARALTQSLALGSHGLPLFGTGDWNDGMNRVGEQGKGESVWLGWFLHAALTAFIPLAEARGETGYAAQWRGHATALADAIETSAWDGQWYLRGYFDNGLPLGAGRNEDCRIDSIAQSWAVLSGAATADRAACAIASVERELIRPADKLAVLFAPPFHHGQPDPGYISCYPAGTRENGGQYTHAALWTVMAFAALGQADKAVALFGLLNPIHHARTRADLLRYKVEPYVVAADIYSVPPHVGRGGWTWYTGSSGWMQRAGIESILGLRFQGAVLHLDPRIPASWPGFEISVRYRTARYEIVVERGDTDLGADPLRLELADDGAIHNLRVTIPR